MFSLLLKELIFVFLIVYFLICHRITTITVCLGGTASSRSTLRYAILHMVAYPDIQRKVQEEIDRVVGEGFSKYSMVWPV